MDINEVKTLLDDNRDAVLAYETKFDRIEYLIHLFEQAYPDVLLSMVADGPISNLIDATNHNDAQLVIQALRYLQTAKGEVLVIPSDLEDNTNEIMNYIQRFITQ